MLIQSGKERTRLMVFLLIGVALVMACGNVATIETGQGSAPTQGSSQAQPTRVTGTQVPDPEGQDTDGDRVLGSTDKCPKEPENYNKVFDTDGCPDNGIRELMEVGAEYINAFWEEEFAEAEVTYKPPTEIVPYTREIDTPCGPAVLNNAFYCPNSHGIYYDLNFLQDQLDTDGDFAPVTILAHEWGHLVQGNLDLLSGDLYTIQIELQADCFAGAWAKYAGDLDVLEKGDLEEGATALFKAGDDISIPWFDPRAHGQPDQRIEYFEQGLRSTTDSCFEQ